MVRRLPESPSFEKFQLVHCLECGLKAARDELEAWEGTETGLPYAEALEELIDRAQALHARVQAERVELRGRLEKFLSRGL